MQKSIEHILLGREKYITEEETVLQPLPHKDFRFANPFIVLHHKLPQVIEPGSKGRIHPHPHRGFAPVTFMLQGEGYHKDNAGHDETIGAGGVQWMFAGKGLLHSEGPTDNILKTGGTQEFIQLWINVPKANKWDDPIYQSANREELPQVLKQPNVNMRLASGTYDGATGPMQTMTPITMIVGEITAGEEVNFTAQPGWWTLLYVVHGSVLVNTENEIQEHHLIVFAKEGDEVSIKATETAQVLFLSAEPIDEPVAAKDNFVMNTAEEVEQALQDYKAGKFGKLDY